VEQSCPKINIFNSHGEKNISRKKYLFIAIMCAKMSRVNKALY
jgi:hypothetical protein